jgi:hypothetical protein
MLVFDGLLNRSCTPSLEMVVLSPVFIVRLNHNHSASYITALVIEIQDSRTARPMRSLLQTCIKMPRNLSKPLLCVLQTGTDYDGRLTIFFSL